MEARTVLIFKAQSIGNHTPPGLTIHVYSELPPVKSLEEGTYLFIKEAQVLEEALHASLPGGTYDHLAALMLKRKASHFRVSYSPEETTDASSA